MAEVSFDRIAFGVVTVSDSRAAGEGEDLSGNEVVRRIEEAGGKVAYRQVVPDAQDAIIECILTASAQCDVLITTGGTGLGPRDVTPEATRSVLHSEAPGIAEMLRAVGREVTPMAALSRGVAGVRGDCLIVNLPGSPKAVTQSMGALLPLLPHAVALLRGDTGH